MVVLVYFTVQFCMQLKNKHTTHMIACTEIKVYYRLHQMVWSCAAIEKTTSHQASSVCKIISMYMYISVFQQLWGGKHYIINNL